MAPLKPLSALLPRFCFQFLLIFFLAPNSGSGDAGSADVTLYAVGDVMLGRHIAKVMSRQGAEYPFREISSTLKSGDIVFGNLEAIISSKELPPAYPNKPYNFHASKNAVQALKQSGFHVLSLANNHALDYGVAPLRETKKLLSEAGIAVLGAGDNLAEARRPAIVTKKGVRFGFLGYSIAHARSVYADRNKAGVAPVRMQDRKSTRLNSSH